jgi:hypothetical protein
MTPLTRWRKLGADRPDAPRSKAALLEFPSTAARTRIVSPNAFDSIVKALAAIAIGLCLSSPPLLIVPVLLGETVPPG